MITKIKKLAIASIASVSFSGVASAAGTLNLDVNVTGSVVASCAAVQDTYTADFGVIPGLGVGKTSINILINCSQGTPYSVKPNYDLVGNVTAFSDAAYQTQITRVAPLTSVGTGSQQSLPVYFKYSHQPNQYETNSIDRGEGHILFRTGAISNNPMIFTIEY